MQAAKFFLIRLSFLALLVVARVAVAQPAAKSAPAQTSALAALHAIDDYEATLEGLFAHSRDPDFPERAKASPHEAKRQRAQLAVKKVSDQEVHGDLSTLLESAHFLWLSSGWLILEPNGKKYDEALADYHSCRNAVATEINTGQRGLLLALLRAQARKKSTDPR